MRNWMFLGLLSAACLAAACGSEVTHGPRGCFRDGREIPIGERFVDGCNDCVCGDDQRITCTPTDDCAVCEHDGERYAAGESFPAGDGCNICQCTSEGEVTCTEAACGQTCIYVGEEHAPGATFPSIDGCNDCTCQDDGAVACTELDCGCDPQTEWWRQYVSEDPTECPQIDFDCPQNTIAFDNSCGCGCEQDHACAESYDCTGDNSCDVDALAADCPFSEIITD